MPRLKDTITNFTGGQVDESVQTRTDIALYEKAAKKAENCALRIAGGVENRPGLLHMKHLINDGSSHTVKSFSFLFNDDQRYIVFIWDDGASNGIDAVRVSDNSACIITFTTTTPWTAAEIPEVRATQLGDVMILFHKNHQPRILRREFGLQFDLELFEFRKKKILSGATASNQDYELQPMLPLRYDLGMEFEATNASGGLINGTSLNVGAGLPQLFVATDVGKTFDIGVGKFIVDTYLNAGQVLGHWLDKDEDFVGVVTLVAPWPDQVWEIGDTIVMDDGAGNYNQTKVDIFHILVDQARVSGSATGRRVNDIPPVNGRNWKGLKSDTPILGSSATIGNNGFNRGPWTEPVYNDDNGWPACGVFHEGRLWIGGGDPAPFHVFGSQSGDYFNFDTGEGLANEAISTPAMTENLAEILHLHSGRNLEVYTNAGMLYAPSTEDEPLTPSNTRFLPQNQYGTSLRVAPANFDNASISVQENNKTVRDNRYDVGVQKFTSVPVSLTAADLLTDIVDGTASYGLNDRDEQYAVFLNSDGSMAAFHSIVDENLRAWVPWIPSTEGPTKKMVSVTSVGNDIFGIIEVLEPAAAEHYLLQKFDFTCMMDLMTTLTHVSGTLWRADVDSFGLIDLLDGDTMSITVSNAAGTPHVYYLGEHTATKVGSVLEFTIPGLDVTYSGRTVHAGLKFTSEIIPLPVSKVFTDGDILADVKNVNALTPDLKDTVYCKVDDQELIPVADLSDLTGTLERFTGLRKFYTLGWDYNQDNVIKIDVPLPFYLRAIIREVEI